jgi:hypothetical protein
MNNSSNEVKSKSIRMRSLAAVVVITVTTVCALGMAAFAGLLPASKGVAVAMTTTPLIDVQTDAAANASHTQTSEFRENTFAVEQRANSRRPPAIAHRYVVRDAVFLPTSASWSNV